MAGVNAMHCETHETCRTSLGAGHQTRVDIEAVRRLSHLSDSCRSLAARPRRHRDAPACKLPRHDEMCMRRHCGVARDQTL